MSSFGRTAGDSNALGIQVIADGDFSGAKVGGGTIDWSLVSAVAADTTLPDGRVVKSGDKYLRYGQILDVKGTAEVQAIDLSAGNDPTAGTWTISFNGSTTSPLAWDISAAALQTALEALDSVAGGEIVVTKSSFVYTVTFKNWAGNVPAMTVSYGSLTGATSVTVTTSTPGVGSGLFGPADTSASDGRQTLARGESYFLNETVVYSELGSDHPPLYEAGTVYLARLITNENNPGTNAPTEANVLTAFPGLKVIRQ